MGVRLCPEGGRSNHGFNGRAMERGRTAHRCDAEAARWTRATLARQPRGAQRDSVDSAHGGAVGIMSDCPARQALGGSPIGRFFIPSLQCIFVGVALYLVSFVGMPEGDEGEYRQARQAQRGVARLTVVAARWYVVAGHGPEGSQTLKSRVP